MHNMCIMCFMSKMIRVSLLLDLKLLEALDRFWHENRLPSRVAAIRDLLKRGLKDDASSG